MQFQDRGILSRLKYLWVILMPLCCACQNREESFNKIPINSGFELEIKSWSFFGEVAFQVVYLNMDPTWKEMELFEKGKVIIIKDYLKTDRINDTLTLDLHQGQEDSIYFYAYRFVTDFMVVDTSEIVNGIRKRKVLYDGGNYSVSLATKDDRMLIASKYRSEGITSASDDAGRLVRFINKHVPIEFKIY